MARDYEQMSDSRFWEIAEHRLGVKYDGATLKTKETKDDEDPWEAGIYREGEERPVVKASARDEEDAKERLFTELREERVRDAFKTILDTLDYKARDVVERYAVLLLGVNHSVFTGAKGKGADDIADDIIRREYRERVQREVREIKDLIRDGDIKSDEEFTSIVEASNDMSTAGFFIDDTPAVGVPYVRAKARRIQRTHGLGLIVIDYLGLMRGTGDNRAQEVGSISRGLKAMAKELRVPVIALAQLNRASEGRLDKKPTLADLRDSGEIEQDADIVGMLHRESMHKDAPEWEGIAHLLIRKNRNGPTGECLLALDGPRMRFSDFDGPYPESTHPRKPGRSKGFEA